MLWLGNCVEVDVDRITTLFPPFPSPPPSDRSYVFVPTHSSLFDIHKCQLFEISARLMLVSVPFSSLLLDVGHLEKRFSESIM